MAKRAEKKLSALEVGRLNKPGMYAVGEVTGLYLVVKDSGARSWILRAVIGAKRRHVGLGGYPSVTLAGAYAKARAARDTIEQGSDPIVVRQMARSAIRAQQAAEVTFDQASEGFLAGRKDGWKNPKHRAQWTATLSTYASPVIGSMLVRDVERAHIIKILDPIWRSKTETASRLRGRIEQVLDWATVQGHRPEGPNPARWSGNLDKVLPERGSIKKTKHHAAIPVDGIAAFMVDLRKRDGLAARALEFLVLTAARSGEIRGATWGEIDRKAAVWTVPAERMKMSEQHQVPLSSAALAVLDALPPGDGADLLFPAPRGGMLSDMTLSAVMRRMKVEAVPHGMRSTFRDWAGERTNFARDLAEAALAHAIENRVEAAYRRGRALEKRRPVMEAWATFCAHPAKGGTVVPLAKVA